MFFLLKHASFLKTASVWDPRRSTRAWPRRPCPPRACLPPRRPRHDPEKPVQLGAARLALTSAKAVCSLILDTAWDIRSCEIAEEIGCRWLPRDEGAPSVGVPQAGVSNALPRPSHREPCRTRRVILSKKSLSNKQIAFVCVQPRYCCKNATAAATAALGSNHSCSRSRQRLHAT